MSTGKLLKWLTGVMEIFLAIPLAGTVDASTVFCIPLLIMLIFHIITYVYCEREDLDKAPSTLGILTSCVAWVPLLGTLLHLLTALFLLGSSTREYKGVRI